MCTIPSYSVVVASDCTPHFTINYPNFGLADGDGGSEVADPFSQMEPEHLARLESALQSEHAKEILGTKLDENLSSMLSKFIIDY